MNTSIISDYGTFVYCRISLDEARHLVRELQQIEKTVQSAIGHQSTADLLATLLEVTVTVNRSEFKQEVDDLALIFKLKERVSAGKILSREELEAIGYEFGLLERTA